MIEELEKYSESYEKVLKKQNDHRVKLDRIMEEYGLDENNAKLYLESEEKDDESSDDEDEDEKEDENESSDEDEDEKEDYDEDDDKSSNGYENQYSSAFDLAAKFRKELSGVEDVKVINDLIDIAIPDIIVKSNVDGEESENDEGATEESIPDLTNLEMGPVLAV